PIAQVTSPVPITTIRLSPDAHAVVLVADQDEHPNVVLAGKLDAGLTRFEATDGVFVDSRRAVLMTRGDTSARVALVDVDSASTIWAIEVPDISWARIA